MTYIATSIKGLFLYRFLPGLFPSLVVIYYLFLALKSIYLVIIEQQSTNDRNTSSTTHHRPADIHLPPSTMYQATVPAKQCIEALVGLFETLRYQSQPPETASVSQDFLDVYGEFPGDVLTAAVEGMNRRGEKGSEEWEKAGSAEREELSSVVEKYKELLVKKKAEWLRAKSTKGKSKEGADADEGEALKGRRG
jgi:hypothetical protein